jgi:6-pyruvoyltetrahydropterin/6-carboxytetrahydropterin synthase
MRVLITKVFTFDAAHQLPWHRGKCRNLHGHTYRLEVTVEGPINENGVVADFADVGAVVKETIIEKYDHQYLNDRFDNPTAEILALSFFKLLEAEGLNIKRVTLWETPTCSATVEGEKR